MPIFAGVLQGAATVLVFTRLWLRLSNKAGQVGLDDVCSENSGESGGVAHGV